MPRYEVSLIMKILERPAMVETLKGLVGHVIKEGNVVRKIQSMGTRGLPVLMKAHGEKHTVGTYVLLDVECPDNSVVPLKKFFISDKSVLRTRFHLHDIVYRPEPPCGGMVEPDYAEILQDAKRSGKHKTKPLTHPYVA